MSISTEGCEDASKLLQKFEKYIKDHYPNNRTQDFYMSVISKFNDSYLMTGKDIDKAISHYYYSVTKTTPYEKPKTDYLRFKARVILVFKDVIQDIPPKKKYFSVKQYSVHNNYITPLSDYKNWLQTIGNNPNSISTRQQRIRVFIKFLEQNDCFSLNKINYDLILSFMSYLLSRYSIQGRSNILYTVKHFLTCPIIYKQLSIEPLLILKNIKTPKHNRIPSTYTSEEIHSVLNSVDRDTKWGKTIYLMMMFASVYGLRVSDIRDLQLSSINWQDKILSLSQQKTQTPLNLPLIYEIELALLDYIKNVRPSIDSPYLFIRFRAPHTPYSKNNHFSRHVSKYFNLANIDINDKHCGLHSMRHSLATELSNQMIPITEVKNILGHTSIQSTKQYVWSNIEQLKKAALEVDL